MRVRPGELFLYWIGGPGRTVTVRREGPRERRLNRDCQNKKQKGKEKRDLSKQQPKPLLTEKLPPPSSSRVRAPAECRRVTAQAALLPLTVVRFVPYPPKRYVSLEFSKGKTRLILKPQTRFLYHWN